ncbi:hypothetical protein D5086_024678 [Populus alba]|uniref:Uncharacterized protein n=1 Tax=Populus alba TaxID=43335 RepID=A0ACC4B6E2_POPAL
MNHQCWCCIKWYQSLVMAGQDNDNGEHLTRLEQSIEGITRSIKMLTELLRVFLMRSGFMHFTWSGFDTCNAAVWAMHGRVAGPSRFFYVVEIWDEIWMTVVYFYIESTSSLSWHLLAYWISVG